MRIVQVTHYMPPHLGGIEIVAQRLFKGYLSRGHDVAWVASRVPEHLNEREIDGRVRVPAFNGVEDRVGVPVPVWGPRALRTLYREIAKADVVHVHDALYVPSAAAVWIAGRLQTPVLLTQHIGLVPYKSKVLRGVQNAGWLTLGKAVLDRAQTLVAATPAAERFLLERCPGRRIHPIANGLDLERFQRTTVAERRDARRNLGLDPNRPVMLFVGRFVEKKGVDRVLEAARAERDSQWVVIGDGPLHHEVDNAPVIRPGRIPSEEIHRWYRAADAFVLPSTGEGLPLTVQEAMASGLACLITGSEDYARDLVANDAAIPVSIEPGGLLRAVKASRTKWSATGLAARSYAERHWSVSAATEQHLRLLQELCRP